MTRTRTRRAPPLFPEVRHPRKRAFLLAFAQLGTIKGAAAAAGLDRRTPYTPSWQRDTVFQEAFATAQDMALHRLEDEAVRRAVEGVRHYKFGGDGTPLRHPELCDCGHGRLAHGPLLDQTGALISPDPRAGPCREPGCPCRGFWGQPYYEHSYSDTLLIFTLKGLLPEKYRDSIEVRDSRIRIDWKRLAAQPGGQALIARIADGEDFRVVLAGVLDGLLRAGIVELGPSTRRALPPPPAPTG